WVARRVCPRARIAGDPARDIHLAQERRSQGSWRHPPASQSRVRHLVEGGQRLLVTQENLIEIARAQSSPLEENVRKRHLQAASATLALSHGALEIRARLPQLALGQVTIADAIPDGAHHPRVAVRGGH